MGKVIPRGYHLSHLVFVAYKFIALPPRTPSMADATAIITFRTVLQPDFFISSTPPFYVILIYAVGSSTISPPPLPPPSGAPADTNAKFTLFGLLVMLRLAFTSFIALSGMKRTFTLLIFFTVHSFSVSPGRQVSVMWKVPSPSIFTLFP